MRVGLLSDPFIFIDMKDELKGGKADNLSTGDIAKRHSIGADAIKKELELGTKDEKEHTDDESKAKEIAKDHLVGNPDYYSDMDAAGIDEEAFPIIRRTLQEAASRIAKGDETPKSTVYIIFDGDRALGGIEISNVSGSPSDDESTLLNISGDKNEKPLKVIRDAVPMLFREVPTMNTLFVPTNPNNRDFWERAGANEVQSGLHAFQRGH